METKTQDESGKDDTTRMENEQRHAELLEYFKTALREDMNFQKKKNAASQRQRASLPVFW